MDYKKQRLLYFAKETKYLDQACIKIISQYDIDFEECVEKCQLLPKKKLDHLRFLFAKNCLLEAACESNYLTKTQHQQFLQQKIQSITQEGVLFRLDSVDLVPPDFYQQKLRKLYNNGFIDQDEFQLMMKILKKTGS